MTVRAAWLTEGDSGNPRTDPAYEGRELRWGAPRIHGELLQLGFQVSEPTISRYLQRLRYRGDECKGEEVAGVPNKHREIIAAF